MSRFLYLLFGWFFLVIGVIGIAVPLLPTTPFLILTAICFSKGSEKMHTWLLNHRIFGPPINEWNSKGVIRLKYKIMATTMMSLSALFVYPKPYIPAIGKIGFSVSFILVMIFIWTRPSK
ncbi:MAG: YbaN family protein [Bdellovibrionaceae bacterium]|nr:YbaN family protein [Pseudobdellovibrionaceae bacterium]